MSDTLVPQDKVGYIQQMRERALAGNPPTEDELREAIKYLRSHQVEDAERAAEGKTKKAAKKKSSGMDIPLDLNDLFKKKE